MRTLHQNILPLQPVMSPSVRCVSLCPHSSHRPAVHACAYSQPCSNESGHVSLLLRATIGRMDMHHSVAEHQHPRPRCRHLCQAASSSVSSSSSPVSSSSSSSPQQAVGSSEVSDRGDGPWCDLTFNGSETLQEIQAALQQLPSRSQPLSPTTSTAIETALTPKALAALPNIELAALLLAVATANRRSLSSTWVTATLDHVLARVMLGMSDDDMPHLAGLLWAVSELGATPTQQWLQAAAQRLKGGVDSGSLFATDLCTILCALGALGYKPDPSMTSLIVREVQLQLKEFLSDFAPRDVARLASGLADLGVAQAFPADFNRQLMKAVYSKVRTIEDKAEVDFALNKLETDNKSMHFDPRWTHEELHWLPRRERDKRRILSEGYVKSQWGGHTPGRDS